MNTAQSVDTVPTNKAIQQLNNEMAIGTQILNSKQNIKATHSPPLMLDLKMSLTTAKLKLVTWYLRMGLELVKSQLL